MNVRRATSADQSTLDRLWRDFSQAAPPPPHVEIDVEQELREVAEIVSDGLAFLAEENGRPLGFALGRAKTEREGRLTDLYVVPDARRRGVASAVVSALLAAFRERGLEYVSLDVGAENDAARAVYRRWGFHEHLIDLFAPLDEVARRLEAPAAGGSFGSIHVQTDDAGAVERAVRQFVPRLPGRSRGSVVSPPRNGWVAVYDDVCDRDPRMLRRLAKELGDRLGAVVLAIGVEQGAVVRFILFERGSIVDEYLSVQEFYGPLPPGDVIALAANPRVVARLTGADPQEVRAAAVHAVSPHELPAPREILARLARAMGVEGAEHGWADAPDLPGAVRVERP